MQVKLKVNLEKKHKMKQKSQNPGYQYYQVGEHNQNKGVEDEMYNLSLFSLSRGRFAHSADCPSSNIWDANNKWNKGENYFEDRKQAGVTIINPPGEWPPDSPAFQPLLCSTK